MSLARRLKKLRMGKNKSLQDVATAVKVSKPHIWQLERGESKNPSIGLLEKLAKYYGTTVEILMKGEESPTSHMVFGRKFEDVDEKTKKLIISMTEQLIENENDK